jgi:hypothetical protein
VAQLRRGGSSIPGAIHLAQRLVRDRVPGLLEGLKLHKIRIEIYYIYICSQSSNCPKSAPALKILA